MVGATAQGFKNFPGAFNRSLPGQHVALRSKVFACSRHWPPKRVIAIAAGFATTLDVTVVIYDLTLDLDTEYDLADGLGTLSAPAAAAGYDVNVNDFTAHTSYAATAGTITFSNVCEGGASGSMSNVTFSEVVGVTNPTPIIGGCSMTYELLNFNIGTCPDPGGQ